jgi:metal-responsive CopG/Arc/MetJ family transcriptional regulator
MSTLTPTPNEAAKRIREMVVVSFKVPGYMLLELDAIAEKLNIGRSWVIRYALSWFVKNFDAQRIYKGGYGGRLRIITFKAPQSFIEFIDGLASSLDISRSELIRTALAMYLDYVAKVEKENGFIVKEGVIRI